MLRQNLQYVDPRHRLLANRESRLLRRFILMPLVVVLLLSGCITGAPAGRGLDEATAITLAALPEGVGRGFPAVQLDESDQGDAGLQEGQMAPNFHLVLEDGRHLSLHTLRGQPVLLNFWATWCGPCRLEMPEIVHVATDNADLVVLAINVQETMEQIQPFADDFQMTLPVARDTDGALRNLYEVRGMPTSVFIDREGKIFTIWTGILTRKVLADLLAGMG
ncbi:MAG: TlpA family protein disulfide reductase [Caldilinea sp. CFX5]|nr:TlpA family protein disulfide reductase [Caldilinea sp. CFX5]